MWRDEDKRPINVKMPASPLLLYLQELSSKILILAVMKSKQILFSGAKGNKMRHIENVVSIPDNTCMLGACTSMHIMDHESCEDHKTSFLLWQAQEAYY